MWHWAQLVNVDATGCESLIVYFVISEPLIVLPLLVELLSHGPRVIIAGKPAAPAQVKPILAGVL